jgi:hypothetical protein
VLFNLSGAMTLNDVTFANNKLAMLQSLTVRSKDLNSSFTNNSLQNLRELSVELYKTESFQNNSLNNLVKLTLIENIAYGNITTLISNTMPALEVLSARSNKLSNMTEILTSYPRLRQLDLFDGVIGSVKDNSHDRIVTLNLERAEIRDAFSNNRFPSLETLNLNINPRLTSFTGNYVPELKWLEISQSDISLFTDGDQFGSL